MTYSARVIADSTSASDIRLTTLELVYPRFIHAEMMTHRVFSRNASSSRAIPTKKLIQMVREEPVMPLHWGKNRPGMQATEEIDGLLLQAAVETWSRAASEAANYAAHLAELGVHKQIVNRILEPFLTIRVVVTATQWANFTALRDHPDAQPEIAELARLITAARAVSEPKFLREGEWHFPYILPEELEAYGGLPDPTGNLRLVSAARCARTSYKTHDGRTSTLEEDLALCERLIHTDLIHASPFEHQAMPDLYYGEDIGGAPIWANPGRHGNLYGWQQHRKFLPNERVLDQFEKEI